MEDKIKAISMATGLNYILLHSGEIYLLDCDKRFEIPDFNSMAIHTRDTYEMLFDCIYDSVEYKTTGNGTFPKSIRVKDIQSMKRFGEVLFK